MAGSEVFVTLLLTLIGMLVVAAFVASVLGPSNPLTYYMLMGVGGAYLLLVLLTYVLWYRAASA